MHMQGGHASMVDKQVDPQMMEHIQRAAAAQKQQMAMQQQQQQQQQLHQSTASRPTTAQSQGSSAGGEPASPAHNAQLAALQAFAQQQRMQQLPQQIQSLQELIKAGKITPEQAQQQYMIMQNASKTQAQQQQQQQQQQQGSSGAAQSGAAPSSLTQDAYQKARDLQALLPQQLHSLQEMIKAGKITQDQAREQYMFLQNAARMPGQPSMQSGGGGAGGVAPSGLSAQDAARKAHELQVQLPQQLHSLQELSKAGKIAPEQAREQYTHFLNAAKMAMLQAQVALQQEQQQNGAQVTQQQAPQQASGPTMPQQASAGSNAQAVTAAAAAVAQQTSSKPAASRARTRTPTPATPKVQSVKKPAPKRARKMSKAEANIAADFKQVVPPPAPTQGAGASQHQMQQQQRQGPLPPPPSSQQLQHQQYMFLQNAAAMQGQAQQQGSGGAQSGGGASGVAPSGLPFQDVAQKAHDPSQHPYTYPQPPQAQQQQGISGAPSGGVAPSATLVQDAARKAHDLQAQLPQQLQALQEMIKSGKITQDQAREQYAYVQNAAKMAMSHARALQEQTQQQLQQAEQLIREELRCKYKIEYTPIRRDMRTHGAFDLTAADAQLRPILSGQGRFPRSVRELGHVDIAALAMSLRSDILVEVTCSLNYLLILTASVQAPGFVLLMGLCEDLFDELMDLLERAAYGRCGKRHAESTKPALSYAEHQAQHGLLDTPWSQHDYVEQALACEERNELRSASRYDYYGALSSHREEVQQAEIALTVIEVLHNLAIIPDNHHFLNKEPRLLTLLMGLVDQCESEQHFKALGQPLTGDVTVFTATDVLRIRKNVLAIVAALAGDTLVLARLEGRSTRILFDFLVSYIAGAREIEDQDGLVYREVPIAPITRPTPTNPHPPPPPTMMQPFTRKVPHYADLAMAAFAGIAQPDSNRRLLSERIPDDKQVLLGVELIKLLPVSDMDFHVLKTEQRLGYLERIGLSLFNVMCMAKPAVKKRLQEQPGVKDIFLRCIARLLKVHADYSHNPFSVVTRRLVETLPELYNEVSSFDRPALLGLGMEAGRQRTKLGTEGVLLENEDAVVDLMTIEGIDPTIIATLERMV